MGAARSGSPSDSPSLAGPAGAAASPGVRVTEACAGIGSTTVSLLQQFAGAPAVKVVAVELDSGRFAALSANLAVVELQTPLPQTQPLPVVTACTTARACALAAPAESTAVTPTVTIGRAELYCGDFLALLPELCGGAAGGRRAGHCHVVVLDPPW
eukprot:SAG22_NODE_11406_length_486_cov_1.452196_1_plen_155_part_01